MERERERDLKSWPCLKVGQQNHSTGSIMLFPFFGAKTEAETRHSHLHQGDLWFREVGVGAKEEGGGHFHTRLAERCLSLFSAL